MGCAAMVCVHGVSKRFGEVRAVERAHLCVDHGELVALVGPSGCGKTSLLRLIAGFEHPDEGEVLLEGRVATGPGRFAPPERRRVGMVFQDYALFPHLSVAENVGFGVARRERSRRVAELLELVGLAGCERRYPHELSGGQQQRVALARALAPQPAVVLLDEPWSNIDPLLRASMRGGLAEVVRAARATVVLVTHDREEAFSLADRVAVMREGRIIQAGSPEDLYLRPADRWTAEFVGPANFVPGRIDGELVETALGRFPILASGNGAREVEVLIRPEQVRLHEDPLGSATVIAREFRGHDVFHRLRLQDGATLVSQRPSTEDVPVGARVSVRAHSGRAPTFV
jgi:iron(III) transport system ATP-binding protein